MRVSGSFMDPFYIHIGMILFILGLSPYDLFLGFSLKMSHTN